MLNTMPRDTKLESVLVVDDDAGIRSLIEAGLSHYGCRVEQAECTLAARELLDARPFSLVLCDYEMPGGTGLELLQYLRREHPDVPLIMLTGYDDAQLARKAIAWGAVDFLAKPFDLHQLTRVIEQNRERIRRDRRRAERFTRQVLTDTIRALVAAVDAKDPHTAHHSERVTSWALRLGAAVGLTAEEMQTLEFAAIMHDVGKIAIPEGILLKPGGLSDEEWALMKKHPVVGYEIIENVGALAEVAVIVRHHHERWDGWGYPDGLAGENIPRLSRIIAIADSYDAMTSNRAYRRAYSREYALNAIRENLGTQFDPELGEAMCRLLETE
jgi:putative two-component system response regulator